MPPPLTSQAEVARVLRVQGDYYAVLAIPEDERGKDLTLDRVRAAARAVALHVHPDRATSRGVPPADATAAAAAVNAAAATLGDPRRRRVYDMWAAGAAGGQQQTSFAEWEAGAAFANAPAWLRRLLARRGGTVCVAVTGLLLLVPAVIILAVLTLLCTPIRAVLWCCGVGRGGGGEEEGEAGEGEAAGEAAAGGGRPGGDVEMGAATAAAGAPVSGAAGEDGEATTAAPPAVNVLGPAGG